MPATAIDQPAVMTRPPAVVADDHPACPQAAARPDWSARRFRGFFPWSSRFVLSPLLSGVVLGVIAILLSQSYPNASLAIVALWVGLLMVNADRPLLGSFILSPTAYLGARQMTGLGGGLLLASFSAGFVESPELRHMLIHGIVGGLAKLAGVALTFRSGRGLSIPLQDRAFQRDVLRPVIIVGWLLLGYTAMTNIVGLAVFGGADRAKETVWRVDEALGWWSWFNLFNNLKYALWVIVPLIWMRSSSIGRAMLVATGTLLVLPDLLGGGRTALLVPAMYVVVGIAMFRTKPLNLDKYLLIAAIPLVPFIAFWEFYRGSTAFRETRLVNVRERIEAIPKAWREYQERQSYGEQEDESKVAGWSSYRYPDPVIYTLTPSEFPFAGWSEWATPQQILIPTFFWRTKPQLIDGNMIFNRYTNRPAHWTGAGISLNADLFRRFGDIGVPIGNFVVGLLYGWVLSIAYRWYHRRNAVAGLVTIIFFGAQGHFGLLDNTCNQLMYQWLYIVPKHIVGILVFCEIARAIAKFPVVGSLFFSNRVPATQPITPPLAA
jgi:hypothetical protein